MQETAPREPSHREVIEQPTHGMSLVEGALAPEPSLLMIVSHRDDRVQTRAQCIPEALLVCHGGGCSFLASFRVTSSWMSRLVRTTNAFIAIINRDSALLLSSSLSSLTVALVTGPCLAPSPPKRSKESRRHLFSLSKARFSSSNRTT